MVHQGSPLSATPGMATPTRQRAIATLLEMVRQGKLRCDQPLPAERDLAQMTDVSRPTLRLILEELTKQGMVQGQSDGSHARVFTTRLADLAFGRDQAQGSLMAQTIAFIAPPQSIHHQRLDFHQTGMNEFVHRGVTYAAHQAGLHTMSLQPESLDAAGVEQLIAQRPRGVIMVHDHNRGEADLTLLNQLADAGIAVVGNGYDPAVVDCDTVDSDHQAGCYMLSRWLIDSGCRRIQRTWIHNRRTVGRPFWLKQRDEGYLQAIHEAGIEPLPAIWRAGMGTQPAGELDFEIEARLVAGHLIEAFANQPPPDAVMAISDGPAFVIAAACRMHGHEPGQDLTLVGYDNYWQDVTEGEWETTRPQATVDKNNPRIGTELVRLLEERVAGRLGEDREHRLVRPRLVEVDAAEATSSSSHLQPSFDPPHREPHHETQRQTTRIHAH